MPPPRPAQLDSAFVRRVMRVFSWLTVVAYRVTAGRVGGWWRLHRGFPRGYPVCLLTTRGRKTGRRRTTPLIYLREDSPLGDRVLAVASQGGMPRHPMWFRNILAEPRVVVQFGRDMRRMRARVAGDDERATLWPRLLGFCPDYGVYQSWTERTLPIVVFEPMGDR